MRDLSIFASHVRAASLSKTSCLHLTLPCISTEASGLGVRECRWRLGGSQPHQCSRASQPPPVGPQEVGQPRRPVGVGVGIVGPLPSGLLSHSVLSTFTQTCYPMFIAGVFSLFFFVLGFQTGQLVSHCFHLLWMLVVPATCLLD